jgi:hypothetical protein
MAAGRSSGFDGLWIPRSGRRRIASNRSLPTGLTGLVLFGLFFAFLAQIQFSVPGLAGTDGYYHIRFAEIMRLQGLLPEFPWLPMTILNAREFYDHHFLYHVALIPFTLGDLIQGGKWSGVLFASLAFLSIWWLFHSQRTPLAPLWSLGLLAVSGAFIYRMSMTRAQSLSLGVLVLSLYLLFNRKYKWLFPLSFIYVWMYDGFPLILITAGAYLISRWAIAREFNLAPLVFTVAGIGLGMFLNPYFPDNVIFIARHILPKLADATSVRVGNEWYPYDTGQLLENSPGALIAFGSGILALGLRDRRMDARTGTTLIVSLCFFLMLLQARRFVEYFPAFALIFSAFAWAGVSSTTVNRTNDPSNSSSPSSYNRNLNWPGRKRAWLPAGILIVFLLPGIWISFRNARESMAGAKPAGLYSAAARWLAANTPPGTRIFQTDWDDFTRLFYYNTHNTYLVGLDPTYLQLYDSSRYTKWVDITEGDLENPSGAIAFEFGAEYVFSDLNHDAFFEQAQKDPEMLNVYQDDEAVIYRISPTH